jgi:hypothetical protein
MVTAAAGDVCAGAADRPPDGADGSLHDRRHQGDDAREGQRKREGDSVIGRREPVGDEGFRRLERVPAVGPGHAVDAAHDVRHRQRPPGTRHHGLRHQQEPGDQPRGDRAQQPERHPVHHSPRPPRWPLRPLCRFWHRGRLRRARLRRPHAEVQFVRHDEDDRTRVQPVERGVPETRRPLPGTGSDRTSRSVHVRSAAVDDHDKLLVLHISSIRQQFGFRLFLIACGRDRLLITIRRY